MNIRADKHSIHSNHSKAEGMNKWDDASLSLLSYTCHLNYQAMMGSISAEAWNFTHPWCFKKDRSDLLNVITKLLTRGKNVGQRMKQTGTNIYSTICNSTTLWVLVLPQEGLRAG